MNRCDIYKKHPTADNLNKIVEIVTEHCGENHYVTTISFPRNILFFHTVECFFVVDELSTMNRVISYPISPNEKFHYQPDPLVVCSCS